MMKTAIAAVIAVLGMTIDTSVSAFTTDPNTVYTVPFTNKPAYLTNTTQSIFGTTYRRIGGDPNTVFTFSVGGSGTWGADARHHYALDEPWNADETKIAFQNTAAGGGTPTKLYLNADFTPWKYCANEPDGGSRWHPLTTNKYVRVIVNGTTLKWFNVNTCSVTKTINLPFAVIDDGQWTISNDGKYVLLHDATRLIAVNMSNSTVGVPMDVSNCGLPDCTINNVLISQSGWKGVIDYNGSHLRMVSVDKASLGLTIHIVVGEIPECDGKLGSMGWIYDLGHFDLAINPYRANEDVAVGQRRLACQDDVPTDFYGRSIGQIVMVSLDDGRVQTLTSPTNSAPVHHISARNSARTGWVYASFFNGVGNRYGDEIIAVTMDPNNFEQVERYGHIHSLVTGCYRCEAHPVPNRAGTKVMYSSNFAFQGDGTPGDPPTGNVQAYVLDR